MLVRLILNPVRVNLYSEASLIQRSNVAITKIERYDDCAQKRLVSVLWQRRNQCHPTSKKHLVAQCSVAVAIITIGRLREPSLFALPVSAGPFLFENPTE